MKKLWFYILMLIGVLAFAQPGNTVLGPRLPGVIVKDNYQEKVARYEYVREADAAWMKKVWRNVDLREKQNHYMYFPLEEIISRRSLIQIIRSRIAEESLTAYNSMNDEFTSPMTSSEALAIGTGNEEVTFQTPEGNDTIMSIEIDFDYSSVTSYRVMEEWYFDKETSYMHVQIIGICPIMDVYDENGELKGKTPMFWLYFPELRNFLVMEESFNRQNDAERRSFDHMLVNRKFSSYVIKESNVYDRNINEYKQGIDAQLEGRRIHEELRDWEQDLWEY